VPVTHAHPAAVLPFIRWRWFNAPALVIGSLIPDFPSFLILDIERASTHSFIGSFTNCIPAGLIAYLLYQALFRPGFYALLATPPPIDTQEAATDTPSRFFSLLKISLSLWIGAITHIFWDGFTHYTGWAAQQWPILHGYVHIGISLPLFRLLQYLSGVIGTVVVAWYAMGALKKVPHLPHTDTNWRKQAVKNCLSQGLLSLLLGALIATLVWNHTRHAADPNLQFRYLIVFSTDAFLVLLLLRGLLARKAVKTSSP